MEDRETTADQLLGGVSQHSLRAGAEAGDDPIQRRAHERRRETPQEGRLDRGLLGELLVREPVLHARHDLPPEPAQRVFLPLGQRPRDPVEHAKRSDVVPLRGGQRRAGVEPELMRPLHERIVLEALISGGVGHLEDVCAVDCVAAEGDVPRGLRLLDANATFEPLAMAVHERDERDGCTANLGRQGGEVIELTLGGGVENLVAVERHETRSLIGRGVGDNHTLLSTTTNGRWCRSLSLLLQGNADARGAKSRIEVFAATRALEDLKDYRERGDDTLPL